MKAEEYREITNKAMKHDGPLTSKRLDEMCRRRAEEGDCTLTIQLNKNDDREALISWAQVEGILGYQYDPKILVLRW